MDFSITFTQDENQKRKSEILTSPAISNDETRSIGTCGILSSMHDSSSSVLVDIQESLSRIQIQFFVNLDK